jgi:hypothetical protein
MQSRKMPQLRTGYFTPLSLSTLNCPIWMKTPFGLASAALLGYPDTEDLRQRAEQLGSCLCGGESYELLGIHGAQLISSSTNVIEQRDDMKEWVVVLRAADAAALWHVHQKRTGTSQGLYINTGSKWRAWSPRRRREPIHDLLVAGLLQDVIEDQSISPE